MELKDLSVYIHIPFCVKKCLYCDFLSFPCRDNAVEDYINAVLSEIRRFDNKEIYRLKTVFIGGGTPSSVPPFYIERLMKEIKNGFIIDEDAEITIEANPGTITEENAEIYIKSGINRISIGLQAAQDRLLKDLGRIHSFGDFKQSYKILRRAGFKNINTDLMFALPAQTMADWTESLKAVADMGAEHISCYSLIIEEGTEFYAMAQERKGFCVSDEEDRRMYYAARKILEEYGYRQYEISNFAKDGFYSRHNCVYWKRGDYIGFGLGASSFLNGFRFKNTDNLSEYINGSEYREYERIEGRDACAEFMFLGLRMTEGISLKEFEAQFGISPLKMYEKEINRFIDLGLLLKKNGRLTLSEKGVDVSNAVFAEFL